MSTLITELNLQSNEKPTLKTVMKLQNLELIF